MSGPDDVNPGTMVSYSASDSNVTYYSWSVPSDWIINSGDGTSSISVTVGDTSGRVTVTPSNNCGENESSFISVYVSPTYISANVIDDKIKIYPNPAQNIVYVEIPEDIQAAKIELFEFTGRILITFNSVHNNSVSINCEDLSSGIYFIRIHADDTWQGC